MQMGPSDNYTLSMKPYFTAVLVFQSVMLLLRLFLLVEIMNSFIMGIIIGLGWYAWSQGMHITFICYWGMMCLINGAFDLMRWIEQTVKSPMPIFSSAAPFDYNFRHLVELLIPISVLLGAPLAWRLYKSATEPDMIDEPRRPSSGGDRNPIFRERQSYTVFA